MATAQAQSGMNRDTAVAQQLTNMVSTVNPWGSTTYSPSGSTSYVDSTGKTVTIPQFTQTTTLTPEQQAIFDKSQAAQSNIAGIAQDQSAKIGEYLNDPFEFNNQDAADWSYDLASSRILPQQARNEEALRTRLVNAGLRPGTQAWNSEMERLTQANTDQLNQLALTGRGQAFAEALATRNQPLNEITALLSGSQVSNPAQMSGPTPQAQVGGVDYSGLVQNQYQQQMAAHNATLGGLFGLAGQGLSMGMKFSDARLKEDIHRIGEADNGLPIYSYRYKGSDTPEIGFMAQDVARERPEAVARTPSGYLAVDYDRASR